MQIGSKDQRCEIDRLNMQAVHFRATHPQLPSERGGGMDAGDQALTLP